MAFFPFLPASIEVETLRAEAAEGKAQVVWLQERRSEDDAQKRAAVSFIEDASRLLQVQQNSTRSEVFRLKGIEPWYPNKECV